MEKIKLIYILGRAYTGSTILEMILGTHPDVFSAGEMLYLPLINKLKDRYKCSCSSVVSKCNFWNKVFNIYAKETKANNIEDIYKLTPNKNYLSLLLKGFPKSFSRNEIENYGLKNHLLFKAIESVSGKSILVDSSKNPYRLYHLQKSDLFDIKVIYLYRDGRASIDSFKRRGEYNGVFGRLFRVVSGEQLMRKMLTKRFKRSEYYGLRYKDLTKDFNKEIVPLFDFLDLKVEKGEYINIDNNNYFINRMNNEPGHIIGGNSYRLKHVESIKYFEAWEKNLSSFEKIAFSILGGGLINKSMNKYIH